MSKLAALAARRRQKENEKALAGGHDKLQAQEKQTAVLSASPNPPPSRHKLLERTRIKEGSETHNRDRTESFITTHPRTDVLRREPQSPSIQASAESGNSPASVEPSTAIRANPSSFAATITAPNSSAHNIESHLSNDFASAISFVGPVAKLFDFTDPSPDDVVKKAQSSKGSN
jgi:hypothetical protein